MPYIYPSASALEGKAKVGSTECVALVQEFSQAPITANWSAGESVAPTNQSCQAQPSLLL
jgi:hypothetical protein